MIYDTAYILVYKKTLHLGGYIHGVKTYKRVIVVTCAFLESVKCIVLCKHDMMRYFIGANGAAGHNKGIKPYLTKTYNSDNNAHRA